MTIWGFIVVAIDKYMIILLYSNMEINRTGGKEWFRPAPKATPGFKAEDLIAEGKVHGR